MIPFFHFGSPSCDCEWRTYDSPLGKGNLVHRLKVRWWLGISSPRRPRWFFGFIRWQQINTD